MKRKPFKRKRRGAGRGGWALTLGVAFVLVASSGAWAYREVTWRPDPAAIPQEDALLPLPEREALSSWLPPDSAVYVRVAFHPALATLLSQGLTGFGFASMAEALPFARFILPGLHAMTGYPLLIDTIGTPGEEQALQAVQNLYSPEVGRHLMALLDQAGREVGLGLYPAPSGSAVPMGITLVARVKDPGAAARSLHELERLLGPKVSDSMRLEGDRLAMSNVRYWNRGLQDQAEFKRAIAHLPEDRFASMYVDAAQLRTLKASYERFLQSGGELGEMLLAPMAGVAADPALERLLERVEREGGDSQHMALAATHRLGMVQGFTYSDWQPQDPDGLRQEATALLQGSSRRSYEAVTAILGAEGVAAPKAVAPQEAATFLKELMSP